jgi:hypothetical protein
MARSNHQTQRDIIAYLTVAGFDGATVAWIGHAVNWDMSSEAGRVGLQKLLRRMVTSRVIKKVRYGRYTATPDWRVWGPGNFGAVENAIAAELKRRGGYAAARHLYGAAFGEDYKFEGDNGERSSNHYFFHKVLRESAWFEHVGHDSWKLKPGADDPWFTVPPSWSSMRSCE